MQQPFDTDSDGDLDFTDFNVYVACWVSQGVESATWTSTPSATSSPLPSPSSSPSPSPTPSATNVASATPTPNTNSIAQILADSSGPHDGCLNRLAPITGYDWFSGASPNPDAHLEENNPHLTWWGQFAYNHSAGFPCTSYVSSVANPPNVRVQMRNGALWVLAQGEWMPRDTGPQGYGIFPVTFGSLPSGQSCGSAPSRSEASGGTSWVMMLNNACLIHPWGGWPRQPLPAGTVCVLSTAEVRLIKDDPNGPDNLDQARVMANVGADIYNGSQDTSPPVDWGIGAFRTVTRDWKRLWMSSCSGSQLIQFPPPLS